MKMTPAFLMGATLTVVGMLWAEDEPFAAWTHRATVQVAAPGLARVELPRDLLDVSLMAQEMSPPSDLRLVSSAGVETPFLMEGPRVAAERSITGENFKVTLQSNTTVIELTVPGGAVVASLALQTAKRDFIKAATLEGTLDGAQWSAISDRELAFRQGGAERLRFDFVPAAWKALRITLDDERSGPVGITGATLLARAADESPVSVEDVRILSRDEVNGETRLRLDIGARNRHLRSLHIVAGDPLFQREMKLEVPQDDGTTRTISGSQSIYRIALEDLRREDLEFTARQLISERIVELRIVNGDNPPLRIEKVEGRLYRQSLVFHAEAAGAWHLFAGNPNAASPRYDLVGLLKDPGSAVGLAASVGAVEANPAYRKEAALPEAGEGGAALDTSAWTYRKAVSFEGSGVVRVELDAEVLAHAATDRRDVRIVQDGRQVPYLLQQNLPQREIEIALTPEPDPKRPSVSQWRIELPLAGHPASQLIASSPTPLFERVVRVWEDRRDAYGNTYRQNLGDARWSRVSPKDALALRVNLTLQPSGGALHLETDNGDNAPLEINAMRVAYQPVAAVFLTRSDAPVHLLYGNRRASAPRYDIRLVRDHFERANRVNATLGAEEQTGRGTAEPGTSGAGSAWLWAALALVVAGLLWIVARLLPAEAGAK